MKNTITSAEYRKMQPKKSKYKNKKVTVNGFTFDSQKEAKYWPMLQEMKRSGLITGLDRQARFELLPPQKDEQGRTVERPCYYVADFIYFDKQGNFVVVDIKSIVTRKLPLYKLKKKLLLFIFKTKIKEV